MTRPRRAPARGGSLFDFTRRPSRGSTRTERACRHHLLPWARVADVATRHGRSVVARRRCRRRSSSSPVARLGVDDRAHAAARIGAVDARARARSGGQLSSRAVRVPLQRAARAAPRRTRSCSKRVGAAAAAACSRRRRRRRARWDGGAMRALRCSHLREMLWWRCARGVPRAGQGRSAERERCAPLSPSRSCSACAAAPPRSSLAAHAPPRRRRPCERLAIGARGDGGLRHARPSRRQAALSLCAARRRRRRRLAATLIGE